MNKTIQVPLSEEDINTLKAGDYVYLSGIIYTARDAAHKRMYESMHKGESLPIELNGNVLYYLGPSPAREGQVIGSAGPTTSSRMDKYTPEMLDKGLKGMVGKGKRSPEVIEAMKRNGAVYFAAVGGAGALLSKCIKKAEVIAYDDLGTEAIRKLEIENLPVIVVIDKDGNVLECVVLEFMDETKEKLRTYCNVVSAYKDGYVVIQIVRKTGNYVTDESGDIRAETKVDREIVFKGTEKVFDSDFFESV